MEISHLGIEFAISKYYLKKIKHMRQHTLFGKENVGCFIVWSRKMMR